MNLPEFMICDNPLMDSYQSYIMHTPTKSLVWAIHQDSFTKEELDEFIKQLDGDILYRREYEFEVVYFQAIWIDLERVDIEVLYRECSEWYKDYLTWCDENLSEEP